MNMYIYINLLYIEASIDWCLERMNITIQYIQLFGGFSQKNYAQIVKLGIISLEGSG